MRPLPTLIHPAHEFSSCDDVPDRCTRCPLYKSRCGGCVETDRRNIDSLYYCDQGACMSACNTCGGSRNAAVPTVCCKSPLLRTAFPDVDSWGHQGELNDLQNFRAVSPLRFAQKGINMHQGNMSAHAEDPYPEGTEAFAVSLRHIWSPERGWKSEDLKDFLQMPSDVKLITLTMTKDDLLEKMWVMDMHGGLEFRKRGIDAWMPLMFSNYHQQGHMANFFNFVRSMRSLKEGGGHFVPMGSSPGLATEDIILEATSVVPQVVFNAQFIINDARWEAKAREALYWHCVLPPNVAFYFVGLNVGNKVLTLKRLLKERDTYFISVTPWLSASHGKLYSSRGKEVVVDKNKISIGELFLRNQKNYMNLCGYDMSQKSRTPDEEKLLEVTQQLVARKRERNWRPG